MRRLRTQNAPYISILSIGVEDDKNDKVVLSLSCGILTSEIRERFGTIEAIHLTTYSSKFLIDALDKEYLFLGSLVRQDLHLAASIHASLKRCLEKSTTINFRLFSIFKPTDQITKEIFSVSTRNESCRLAA